MIIIIIASDLAHKYWPCVEISLLKKTMPILNVPITQLMTTEITSVSPDQKLIDVKHIFEKKDFHHHIPVIEKGKLKGMISLIDFLFAIKDATLNDNEYVYHNLLVKDIMKNSPVTISHEASLRDACKILEEGNVHALVVCENKTVKGILSTTDLIRYFLAKDEQ